MKRFLLWLTFPVGHLIWTFKGYKIWTFRKRKRWYYLPMYSDGKCGLYFYHDVLWAESQSKSTKDGQ